VDGVRVVERLLRGERPSLVLNRLRNIGWNAEAS
jgi:hypothetical protein